MGDLIKSLGGDFKWMKDAEIEEMANLSLNEVAYVRDVISVASKVRVVAATAVFLCRPIVLCWM